MHFLFSKIGYVLWGAGTLPVAAREEVVYQDYTRIYNTKHLDGMPEPILSGGEGTFQPHEIETVTNFVDKDDTSLCSGGFRTHGQDTKCAGPNTVYPGFVSYTRALIRNNDPQGDGPKFIQVSARPESLGTSSKKAPGTELNKILDDEVESGSNWTLVSMIGENLGMESWRHVGREKVNDMEKRKKKLEEEGVKLGVVVWNGDDGQGDAYAAGECRKRKVTNVNFIQQVGGSPYANIDTRRDGSSNDIVYYLNYAHLASMTAKIGLIRDDQAKDVYLSILNSAFGKSCCNDTTCRPYNDDENKVDGTCGYWDQSPEALDTVFKFEGEKCHAQRHAVYNLKETGTSEREIDELCPSAKKARVCQCQDMVDDEGFGNCVEKNRFRDGRIQPGCYVKSPLFTTCGDAERSDSKGFENQLWSTEACSQRGEGETCFNHEMCSDDYYCSKSTEKGTYQTCQLRKKKNENCQGVDRKCKKDLKCGSSFGWLQKSWCREQ